MKRRVKWYILLASILIGGFIYSGKLGIADESWDEDDAGEPEVFDEDDWETGDTFDTDQYSVELIEGGIRIISCQIETEPETLQTPTEITYGNKNYPVLEIGDEAFAGISCVKEIEIAEGIRQIGDYAFSGCEQLEQVTIPQSTTGIGSGAFSECPALHRVQIDKENKSLSITGNCLYQNRKILVWCFPEAEEVILSEETKTIAEAAFSGCQLLTELDIPASVTLIEENAFEECTGLDTIHWKGQSVFQLQKNSFPDIEYCTMYVENEAIKSMVEASESYEGKNITVVVKKEYALQYECNGGSLDEEVKTSYSNQEEILLPEPDREGFLFLGWSETPEDQGEYIVSYEAGTQGDKTLYAMWEPDTEAEDTSLLSEEEEQLMLQQDDETKIENKNILKRSLTVAKKKSSVTKESNNESAVNSKDNLTETGSEDFKETKVVNTVEETQNGQVKEAEQTGQPIETLTEIKAEPQQRKASTLVIPLFIGGILLTIGSLGGMFYFHVKENKERADNH